jgi:opacity protein-like surface antigen
VTFQPRGPGCRTLAALLVALAAGAGASGPGPAAAEQRSLQDQILDSKYRWGDYGIYLGWHDPAGRQFHLHGSSALPFGVKVRLRWGRWIRFEGDVSYYRKSGEARPFVTIFDVPAFDGLVVATSVQAVAGRWQRLRPYAGAGPVFVSLTNDFVAVNLRIEQADPTNPDQLRFVTWNELDFGWQVGGGIDVDFGRRLVPFVEYRHLFGEFATDEIRDGGFRFRPEHFRYENGGSLPSAHDWSGPIVMAGLKVRF